VRELANSRMIDHARVLGATMRVAYLVSGAMPGVLPNTPLVVERGKLKLKLSGKYRDLAGERVFARLKQLARLIGREPVMVAE
jgi:exopolyphosphatase / guanosine-5'-triphosphate,3'-diphosphate pyrophosphatase